MVWLELIPQTAHDGPWNLAMSSADSARQVKSDLVPTSGGMCSGYQMLLQTAVPVSQLLCDRRGRERCLVTRN